MLKRKLTPAEVFAKKFKPSVRTTPSFVAVKGGGSATLDLPPVKEPKAKPYIPLEGEPTIEMFEAASSRKNAYAEIAPECV